MNAGECGIVRMAGLLSSSPNRDAGFHSMEHIFSKGYKGAR